jgi:hypothetical protein
MDYILLDEDFESVELANAIWNEITAPKVDSPVLVRESERDVLTVKVPIWARPVHIADTQLQPKKSPLWKRILRTT